MNSVQPRGAAKHFDILTRSQLMHDFHCHILCDSQRHLWSATPRNSLDLKQAPALERVLRWLRPVNAGSHADDPFPDERPEGRYANRLHVGHNAFEFVFDFLQQYNDEATRQSHTRVITSPAYAKAFLHTLAESIADYEREFGAITAADSGSDARG